MSLNLRKSFNLLRLQTLCNLLESNDGVNDVQDTWTRISSFFDHVGFVDEILAFEYQHLLEYTGICFFKWLPSITYREDNGIEARIGSDVCICYIALKLLFLLLVSIRNFSII